VVVAGTEAYTCCEVCAIAETAVSRKTMQINRKQARRGCWMQKAQGRSSPRDREERRVRWAMGHFGPRDDAR